jgi:hypothetical protein
MVLVVACSPPQPAVDVIATEVANHPAGLPTGTPYPTYTPYPTLTSVPTLTITPTPAIHVSSQSTTTSKPEQMQLTEGTFDACLLLKPLEIENLLEVKVQSGPVTVKGTSACKYVTSDEEQLTVLLVTVYTDATLKQADMDYDPVTWYEQNKKIYSENLSFIKMTDLVGLGDRAHTREGSLDEVHVIKNGLYYTFSSRKTEVGGFMPLETLIEFAKIAMQHAP